MGRLQRAAQQHTANAAHMHDRLAADSLTGHSCGSGPQHQQMLAALSRGLQSSTCGAAPAARGCGRVTLHGSLGVLGKGLADVPVQGRGGTKDGLIGGRAGSTGRESRSGGAGKMRRRSD
jgi:hypothetical protein